MALVTAEAAASGAPSRVLLGRLGRARGRQLRRATRPRPRRPWPQIAGRRRPGHGPAAPTCPTSRSRGGGCVAEAEARLGPLDVLVVNHGIWKHAPLAEHDARAVGRDPQRQPRRRLRGLPRRGAAHGPPRGAGAIVLIASTAGQRGEADYAHYAATKGALIAFTKLAGRRAGAARDPRQRGRAGLGPHGHDPRTCSRARTGGGGRAPIPLGRPARPEEIAGPGRVPRLRPRVVHLWRGAGVNGGAVMAD